MYGILKAFGSDRKEGDVIHKQNLETDSKGDVLKYGTVDDAFQHVKDLGKRHGAPDIIRVVELDGDDRGKPLSPKDRHRIQMIKQGVPLAAL